MDTVHFLMFAGALFIAALSPGPAVAAIIARTLGRGGAGMAMFAIGLTLGDLVWLSLAIFGLAALAHTFEEVFLAIRYLGAAYLLFLAWKLWTAPVEATVLTADMRRDPPGKLLLGGWALSLGNPKTAFFYMAILPTFIDPAQVTLSEYAVLSAAVGGIVMAVLLFYIALAVRARRFFTDAKSVRRLNRGTGVVLASAAVAIAMQSE